MAEKKKSASDENKKKKNWDKMNKEISGEEVAAESAAEVSEETVAEQTTEEVTISAEDAAKIFEKFEELNDKYLHVVAEYDNYRKRAQKEREGVYADAYADALGELLPIVDNLERAITFTGDKVTEGVQMTLNQLNASLEKLGIESFGEAGESFDPNIHNAVMHAEDESLGENVITDVFQKGYRKGDRIIRFAMVKVAN